MSETMRLFEPGNISGLSIKNRVVMAPMGILGLTEEDGRISKRGIDYYVERAKGGVGLIISGICLPTLEIEFKPLMEKGVSPLLRSDTRDVIPRLKELTDSVHDYGTKIVVQLSAGFGRVLSPHFQLALGLDNVAPSALPNVWDLSKTTRELTTEEVEKLVNSFGNAAEIVTEAGFDGIELHGHEGYMMDQFITSIWNRRTDKYGGTLDGRLRFILEIIENIKCRAGKDFPVIFRYAVKHYIEGGRDADESIEIAKRLEQAGVDALHVDAGCYDDWYWPHPPNYQPPGCMVDMAETVRKDVKIPVITVGRLGYPGLAEDVLQGGKADFIALGRPLLADPYWPIKVLESRAEEIVPCIGCHEGCLRRGLELNSISCAVNPACGNEKELDIKSAERSKTVLVVGGGIAGMEAARVASLRGHTVTLFEKGSVLGGHLIPGSVPDFKKDVSLLQDYYVNQLAKKTVKIELGKEVTPGIVEEIGPDVLIVATGSKHIIPNLPGIERHNVVTATDVLLGKKTVGKTVVVAGGGLIGCETAIYLSQQDKRVTIVEKTDSILSDVFEANKQYLLKMLAENHVSVLTDTALSRVTDEHAVVTNKVQRYQAELKTDTVVLALGLSPDNRLVKDLEGKIPELHVIGDCKKPGIIMDAVWSAFHRVRLI